MTAEHPSSYYTFSNSDGDASPWTATHSHYRAPSNAKERRGAPAASGNPAKPTEAQSEPVFVKAHIIDEKNTAQGRTTTWTNTGNNPAAGFHTSWTSQDTASSSFDANTAGGAAVHASGGSRLAGALQTAAGLGVMAAGVPLLILPGPGVAVIAGGAVLAGTGVKKLLGKR